MTEPPLFADDDDPFLPMGSGSTSSTSPYWMWTSLDLSLESAARASQPLSILFLIPLSWHFMGELNTKLQIGVLLRADRKIFAQLSHLRFGLL